MRLKCTVHLTAALLLSYMPSRVVAQNPVADQVSCGQCTIELRPLFRLGTLSGAAALPAEIPSDMLVDSQRRLWVFYARFLPMVFDEAGGFVATAGRRGPGPGELEMPVSGLAVGDSVIVLDRSRRQSVFGPKLDVVRSMRLDNADIVRAVALQWPTAVLASGFVRSPDNAGFPLHVLDMSASPVRISRSFGSDGTLRPNESRGLPPILIPAGDGTAWSVDRHRYQLSRLDSRGEAKTVLLRTSNWFPANSAGAPGGPSTAPDPLVTAVAADSAGLLWVYIRVPSARWEKAWADVRERYGSPAIPPGARGGVPGHFVPQNSELYDTIVEVIDPAQRAVVARLRLDRYVMHVLTDGRVALYHEAPDGSALIALARPVLRRR